MTSWSDVHMGVWLHICACLSAVLVVACRATSFARNNQAQVKKLRNIVQLEVGGAGVAKHPRMPLPLLLGPLSQPAACKQLSCSRQHRLNCKTQLGGPSQSPAPDAFVPRGRAVPLLCPDPWLLQARQLSELLDFAEQERLTLLEREASLQQELEQVRPRLVDTQLHCTTGTQP